MSPHTNSHHPRKPKKPTPKREPVAYASIVSVLVAVAAYLGFDLDRELATLIVGAVVAVAGLWARSKVTPTDD